MRTKNARPIRPDEREHMALVKRVACSVCDGAGGFAHHVKQGLHFTTVALCYECHQGAKGWHGDKTLWRIFKQDEWTALNTTLARVKALEKDAT